jgi:hypothetical protein
MCIKTHTKASPEFNTWLTSKSTLKGLIITNRSLLHDNVVQSFENSRIKLNDVRTITRGQPWLPSFIVFHPLQLPARRDLSRSHNSNGITWNNRLARLSILILSKTYRSVITTTPTLDMRGFFATGVSFAKKQQRVGSYFQDFNTNSSWLLFSKLASYYKRKLYNTINQA